MIENETPKNPKSEHYTSMMMFPLNFEFPQRHWGFTIYPLTDDGKIVYRDHVMRDERGREKTVRVMVKAFVSKCDYGHESGARAAAAKKIAQLERQRLQACA